MKNLLKILTMVAAVLAAALFFAGCKQFLEDPEEFLNYWASEVIAGDYSIDKPTQTNTDGVQCIPSTSGVRLTVKLHNPKNFTLVMPTSSAEAGKVINFPGLSPQPVYSTEYTLQQAGSTLNLVYKSAFLKKHEWSSQNIGPEITLISTDGRKFSKKFSLNLKVDTPPKLSSSVTIGKTTKDGKHYYVIILKADEMSLTAGTATPAEKLHKDIEKLSVAHGAGGNPENISFTPGYTAFAASGRLLAATDVTQITSTDLGGQTAPPWESTFNADPWALRYRTDTEVKTASKTYTFTLIDAKGLKSSPITVPTPLLKAEDVQLSHGTPPNTIPASISPPSNPYTINAGLTDMDVTVTAKTATSGAIITGKVEKQDGSGWGQVGAPINSISWNEVDIRLPAPEYDQEVLYKISLTAGGAGFATGTEKTFFVKVTKHTTTTIDVSNSATWEGKPNAWEALKYAVEKVTGPSKIIISGAITAPSGAEIITVNRAVTIQGSNKANDKLDADNRTYIFDISGNGNLKLEKLTLQRGKNTDPYRGGGAIYCAGATLTTDNVIIESCEAKNGGAIYAKEVFVSGNDIPSVITLNNTQIKSCAATGTEDGRGGAICCIKSTLTLDNTTIGGSVPADGNTAVRGGGIYFDFEGGRLNVSAGSFISYNKATNATGVTVGGGGVYIQGGEFVLNGEVSDNKALYIVNGLLSGGGVYVGPKAKFIMNAGAKISGNKAPAGAGVYISAEHAGAGSFTMEGGEIYDCHAGGPLFTNAQGGGVYIKADGEKKGSFTMKGGTITGCTAEANTANGAAGGGVYADVETVFKMSGGAVITPSTPNTLTKSFNDVYLHDAEILSGGGMGSIYAKIIVTGTLANNPVARLTMRNDYTQPLTSGYHWRNVVEGVDGTYTFTTDDESRFEVTPQVIQQSPLTLKNWKVVKVGNAGQLQPDP